MFSKIHKSFYTFIAISAVICAILCVVIISTKKQSKNNDDPMQSTDNKTVYPTVIIDAGHGGEDGGAIGANGVFEKDLNLMIALELDALLRAEGIETRLTRAEDMLLYDRNVDYEGRKKALDMAARVAIAEEYDNAVFISIHMNSFPQEKYSGLQVYYSENSPMSEALAKAVQELTVKNLQPNNNRKIKPSENSIYLLDNISHPSILIECGFLSNKEECELLCTKEYRSRLCMTVFSAIMKYFDTYRDNST